MGDEPEKSEAPAASTEESAPMDQALADMFGKKKKKKKKAVAAAPAVAADVEASSAAEGAIPADEYGFEDTDPWGWKGKGEREYAYDELVGRLYSILRGKNPELVGEKKRYVLKPPQIFREGRRKVVFQNFEEICQMMKRSLDHVMSYMLTELGTTGSLDASNRLVIRGRFTPKHIESLLKRYITEYVKCKMCGLPDTELNRDSVTRLHFVLCNGCNSRRSVAPIKQGYTAQIGRRKRVA